MTTPKRQSTDTATIDARLRDLLQEAEQLATANGLAFHAACYDASGTRVLHAVQWFPTSIGESVRRFQPEQEIAQVAGQWEAKRALEVAAAGGHNILLIGPPGAGKAMLARTLPTLLPSSPTPRPLRTPHSSFSLSEMVGKGAGNHLLPGELCYAHGGVLLLENLAAFAPRVLIAVRQAVRERVVVTQHGVLPSVFHLVATMEPCPCGFSGDPLRECTCTAEQVIHHQKRVGKAMADCFDLVMQVPGVDADRLARERKGESSASIRVRVEGARACQYRRFSGEVGDCNAWMEQEDIQRFCQPDAPGSKLLTAAIQQLHLPIHAVQRLLRVARTIADLAESEQIMANHIAEAVQYRSSTGSER